ncbi:MAG TPA: aminotransferase class V-fold PLP-dependent enzyme [Solirubrobacteraceae bacterium]|jgi:glutamate/tyrosine decarboxylase-like PLP-dependent enzyme
MTDRTSGLDTAVDLARRYLDGLDDRHVGARATGSELRDALAAPLPDEGEDPSAILEALAAQADPGVVASSGPRHFGFVMGGSLPAALGADWLSSAWDQAPGFHVLSPAGAAIEEVAGAWIVDLLGLSPGASFGFVTGGQGANTTCLAAARHRVLRDAGHDVERDGLVGAPPVRVLIGEQAHATIQRSLRLLGLGSASATPVAADDQGRMRADALADALGDVDGPTIVCAQAGNVASGAFDPFEAIAPLCRERGAWLHVDGAFGLWAAAAPSLQPLVAGVDQADSWGVDNHKWLNVPYDNAIAIVRDVEAHMGSMAYAGPYLVADPGQRDSANFSPESSRRGRAIPVYAALRSLGRRGVAELVERNCAQARQMAGLLSRNAPGAEVLNDVVLNQVLVRFPGGDDANRAIIAAVQRDGTCWLGGTSWNGEHVVRISFTNWSTTAADVERSAAAIVRAAGE